MDMKISNMLLKMMADIQKTEGTSTAAQLKYSVGQIVEAHIIAKDDDSPENKIKQIIRKFGVTGEKEIMQIMIESARLPCDDSSAVKYLLDPHLLLALFIPGYAGSKCYQRLEIYEYKGHSENVKTSEVRFNLELDALGRIEILMKSIDSSIYTRIWAESPETQKLLEDNRETLSSICPHTRILVASEGPLFTNEAHGNIDFRI